MDAFPRPVVTPEAEIVVDRLPAREVVWQGAPGTAVAHHVDDGVDDLTPVDRGGTTAGSGLGNLGFDPLPLRVSEVGRVSLSHHPRMLPNYPLLRQALRDDAGIRLNLSETHTLHGVAQVIVAEHPHGIPVGSLNDFIADLLAHDPRLGRLAG